MEDNPVTRKALIIEASGQVSIVTSHYLLLLVSEYRCARLSYMFSSRYMSYGTFNIRNLQIQ